MSNPYKECPTYETSHFIIRLISENDAEGLLKCYSDVNSRPLFNSDMCMGDFNFNTIDEMKSAIIGWLGCYAREEFIRYSIVNKETSLAVGTLEMFGDDKVNTGVLRLDILSEYEREKYLTEILSLCSENFFDDFSVEKIVTKAIPIAKERINYLVALGFEKYKLPDRENYYALSK
ncbi:GNAT family N-acetyltransferase [Serratia sp. D1N4]